ncbi:MAG: SIP domain-containing protein, partial [Myxococcota bacterium]
DFSFDPGQFVWLGTSERVSLPMAIASGVRDPFLEFTIRRSPNTEPLFQREVGATVSLSSPKGTAFPLHAVRADTPVLLVAGGTGVTPIRSTLRSLPEDRVVQAVVGARSAADALYLDEFGQNPSVRLTVEDPSNWDGAVGRVTDHLNPLDPSAIAFVCGPDAMMRAVRDVLLRAGLSSSSVYLSVQALDRDGNVLGPVLANDDPVLIETLS